MRCPACKGEGVKVSGLDTKEAYEVKIGRCVVCKGTGQVTEDEFEEARVGLRQETKGK